MKRILVVEDGRTERKYYGEILAAAGFQVVEAANGYEGWEKALETPFDLVVADVNMPKVDGLSLIGLLRREGVSQRAPVVLISSEGGAKGEERELASGADRYLVKPVLPDSLRAAVREAMEARE